MTDLRIGRMTTSVTEWPDPDQVPSMLRRIVDERLDDAMRQHPLPDGEWCVQRLDVAVELDPERPLSALETNWADRVLTALRQSLVDGSTDVVHYRRPEDAIDHMLGGLVAGDHDHAWAWRLVGLVGPGDPEPAADPCGLLLLVLGRLTTGVTGAIARLIAQSGVARVHRMLGSEGWQRLARLVAAEAQSPWDPAATADGQGDRRAPAAAVDGSNTGAGVARDRADERQWSDDAVLARLSTSVVGRSEVAAAFRASGLRVDADTLRAWSVLALAATDPAQLRRSADRLEHLLVAVADRLQPEAASGLGLGARGPRADAARSAARATSVSGSGSPRADDVEAESPDEAPATEGPASEWGGLLFLLNTAADAALPDALDDRPLVDRTVGWVLHRVGRRLAPVDVDDPALLAFAAADDVPVDDEDEGEVPALDALAHRWAARTAELLRGSAADAAEDAELVRRIAHRGAIIERRPGWIEATFRLDAVDLDVRRAGLDLDPGWVPWLGHVVRFRYE
ncbi:hypothetical protein [uncultured Microbacterium sp.]|uniref:hypothetical protein n=1 Tax=uncultured Microbacterium sp. TaxID=191216 RepID=UPI00261C8E7C|nr:hypothetical protein [uncultured Microbacterium sp.]